MEYLGWVVQFLITVRHGVPSQVGNVASGFWGGLMVGRLVLADITHKFGERKMISLYILLALAMELLFWFIPSVVANAVVISIFGKLNSMSESPLVLTKDHRFLYWTVFSCWNIGLN